MDKLEFMQALMGMTSVLFVFGLFAVLDAVLKAFALWRSARKNQVGWFVCLIIFNTCGILPLIYLLANKKEADNQ